jgi:MFS family permease
MSLGALTYALSSPFVGAVFNGVPRRYVFFLGFILATVSLLYFGNSHALGYPNSIALLVVGILLLGVSVSLIFVPLLSEIIETVQEKEGLGENPLLNDKASAVFNASYATGCVLGPIVGSELFEKFSVFDGAKVVVSGFPHTCDIMAACAAGFCCIYFLVNILPHWFKSSKPKKVVIVNDIEKTPIIVNLEDSRSQLRIENIDDSFSGLKKPMLGSGNDKSIANNQTMAGTIHQSFDDSYKLSD